MKRIKRRNPIMVDLSKMTTENRNPDTMDLDTMTPLELVTAMNREDRKVAEAVEKVLPQTAKAVEWVCEAFEAGGRLIYMGAGTSGRLGILDSSECPPTFGVDPGMVIGLIAGGDVAIRRAVEGAEDSETLGIEDLKALSLTSKDVVAGIAASGRTPYVWTALSYAKSIGCRTISIACNEGSLISKFADLSIEPVVGPEVLTGSTRLKAGTAQKMILNMISTGAMVSIGKAYQNLMVDMVQNNEKLRARAENILMAATEIEREEARRLLNEAGGSVKLAIAMKQTGADPKEAEKKLKESHGHIRAWVKRDPE
jgi:N-acetylmuramic acid 6-phosphate etherase